MTSAGRLGFVVRTTERSYRLFPLCGTERADVVRRQPITDAFCMEDVAATTLDEGARRARGGAGRAAVMARVLADRADVELVGEVPGDDAVDGNRFEHSLKGVIHQTLEEVRHTDP